MDRVTLEISLSYVRPVAQTDLLITALRGLYVAAERTVPSDLEERVRKVCNPNPPSPIDWMTTSLSFLPQPLPQDINFQYRLAMIRTMERINDLAQVERANFLTSIIREVGKAPALKGKDPLVICCQAIAKSLDPYTKVVTADEARRHSGYEGEGTGIGVEAEIQPDGSVLVNAVYPGGPAQKAGILPGDRLTAVGDEDGDPISPSRILDVLAQGPVMTLDPCAAPFCGPVTLTWERDNGRGGKGKLPRQRFNIETVLGTSRMADGSWDFTLDSHDHLALVRIASFSRGTSAELQRILEQLVHNDVRGVVLDLRWCPGGYLDEALDAARLFLADGLVASIKGRRGDAQEYRATAAGPFVKLPLVVLVNGDTSGGAELVAAALQDHQRAKVVGHRTLGKGSVQTPLHVDITGIGFNLTAGTFHRPSGRELHRFPDSKTTDDWGVRPDVVSRVSSDRAALLKRQWLEKTLRPAQISAETSDRRGR